MADPFDKHAKGLDSPCDDGVAVTPSDVTNLTTYGRCLYVGSAGNVALVTPLGTVLTFVGVPAGTVLPWRVKRVNSTNTTAGSLVAGW